MRSRIHDVIRMECCIATSDVRWKALIPASVRSRRLFMFPATSDEIIEHGLQLAPSCLGHAIRVMRLFVSRRGKRLELLET